MRASPLGDGQGRAVGLGLFEGLKTEERTQVSPQALERPPNAGIGPDPRDPDVS